MLTPLNKRNKNSKLSSSSAPKGGSGIRERRGQITQERAPGTKVVEFRPKQDSSWVRVHGERNREGNWLMRKEAIEGLSPQQIKLKYSLRDLPSHVSDVHVTAGTKMHRGKVAENFGGQEGAVQYHLQEKLHSSSYKNTRKLPGSHEEL